MCIHHLFYSTRCNSPCSGVIKIYCFSISLRRVGIAVRVSYRIHIQFSIHNCDQISYVANTASYPMGTSGLNLPVREADNSSPSSVHDKHVCLNNHTVPSVLIVCCLNKQTANSTFSLSLSKYLSDLHTEWDIHLY
jgi:hypothetical protein